MVPDIANQHHHKDLLEVAGNVAELLFGNDLLGYDNDEVLVIVANEKANTAGCDGVGHCVNVG